MLKIIQLLRLTLMMRIMLLKEKRIKGAGIDVFGVEPLPVKSEFRKLDNVILTPHTGYFTEKSYQIFHDQMVENILAWHSGETIRQLT